VTYHIILLHHVVGVRLIYYTLVSLTTQVSSACCFFTTSFNCQGLPSVVENIFHWQYKFTHTNTHIFF